MLTRKSIMHKTLQVASSTLISRFLGIFREFLTVRYMGASALSDAFFTAFKVPNTLRRLFAEGALSAAFVPTVVQKIKTGGKEAVASTMTLGFIVFESMVLTICLMTMLFADPFIAFIAPGFSLEQIENGALFLRILMPFIFFVSSSALIAGPLQAVGHFFIPAFGPVILNIIYITGLFICMAYQLPVATFCWTVLIAGLVQLIAHLYMYFKLNFTFGAVTRHELNSFGHVMVKFALCLLSMSVVEVGVFIDTSFGSYLPKGSVSLIHYANRFMGIPLGVFAVAFSTILLPHFARVSGYAPKRLGFYLLEATKLVWWITLPATIIMMIFSQKVFTTIFLSDKFTIEQAQEAGAILTAFLCGLFFFAINKILSNVYYALHNTIIPGLVATIALGINFMLARPFLLVWQGTGLAATTALAGMIQTVLLFGLLKQYFDMPLYLRSLADFIARYAVQLIVIGLPFIGLYHLLLWLLIDGKPFFIESIGFWLWVAPLCGAYIGVLFYTRRFFGVRILFLEG